MPLACLIPSLGVGGGRSSRAGYIKCPNPPQHPLISRTGREGEEPLSERAPLSGHDFNKENWQLHHTRKQHFPGSCSFNVHVPVATMEDNTNTEMEVKRVRKLHYQQNGNIFRTRTMSPTQLAKIPSLPAPTVYEETKETSEKGRLGYCDSSITSPSSTAASTLSTSLSSLDTSYSNYSVPVYDHHRVNDTTVSPTHVSVHKSSKSRTNDSSSGRYFYNACPASLATSRVENISNGTSTYRNDNAGFRQACIAAITSRSAGHQQQRQSQLQQQASVAKQHASTKADMSFPILSTRSRSRENDGTDGKAVNRETFQQHHVSKSRTLHVSQCSFEHSSNATAAVRRQLSTNGMSAKKASSTTTRRFNEPSPSSRSTSSAKGIATFDEEEFSIPEFPSSYQSTKQRNRSRNDKTKKTSDDPKKNLGTARMSNNKKKNDKTTLCSRSHRNIPNAYEAYLEARKAYECGRNFDPVPTDESPRRKRSVPAKSTASMLESPSHFMCLQFAPSRQNPIASQSPRLHVFDAVDFFAPPSGCQNAKAMANVTSRSS